MVGNIFSNNWVTEFRSIKTRGQTKDKRSFKTLGRAPHFLVYQIFGTNDGLPLKLSIILLLVIPIEDLRMMHSLVIVKAVRVGKRQSWDNTF